jgi:DNA recombination protein RmuC
MSEMAEARAAMLAARLETGELKGLFAEVIRRPGLTDFLQREYRVLVAGPTTLAALLNALQMGFRTLKIQKGSSDVLRTLRAVKTEFGGYVGSHEQCKKEIEASFRRDRQGCRSSTCSRCGAKES